MAQNPRRPLQPQHFTEEAWADLARPSARPEQGARLERHLEDGCAPCAQTLGVWTAVAALAAREGSYEPPSEAVTRLKEQFALRRPPRLVQRAVRSVQLIFDSFRQPVLAGVRAAGDPARQLLYKAGRYLIRLQIERLTDSDHLCVVGQIVNEANPKDGLRDLPVLLLNQDETLVRTLTNTLGEFQMESVPSENLRLSVGIPEIGTLTLPGRLAAAGGPGADADPGTRGGWGRRTKARHA